MSRETYYRVVPPKTYPFGRVCEAKGCTTRLSIYNEDELCATCDEKDRLATMAAQAQERREAELMQSLMEAARA